MGVGFGGRRANSVDRGHLGNVAWGVGRKLDRSLRGQVVCFPVGNSGGVLPSDQALREALEKVGHRVESLLSAEPSLV